MSIAAMFTLLIALVFSGLPGWRVLAVWLVTVFVEITAQTCIAMRKAKR